MQNSGLNKPFIFFGTEDFSLISLKKLVQSGFIPFSVVTKPDTAKGRGMKITPPEVKKFAIENNIPVWQPKSIDELNKTIIDASQDFFGVLVSFGRILPQSTLDLFKPGIINLHPSMLPKYRGPSPIEAAIINGDQETGATIMQLSSQMDAGPIYATTPLELTGTETKPQLYQTLGEIGSEALIAILPEIINNNLKPLKQEDDLATYCSVLTKENSYINPETQTAVEIERQVRAHLDFPKTSYVMPENNQKIIIQKTKLISPDESSNKNLVLKCKDNTFIEILELTAPSGKKMSGQSFKNGLKTAK